MEVLPDFSNSKIIVRNRIEGALREHKRKPNIYQYSLLFCFFFFTSICTALYIKTIILGKGNKINGTIDYYSLEQIIRSEQLDSDIIIELPNNISLITTGESNLVSSINLLKDNYE